MPFQKTCFFFCAGFLFNMHPLHAAAHSETPSYLNLRSLLEHFVSFSSCYGGEINDSTEENSAMPADEIIIIPERSSMQAANQTADTAAMDIAHVCQLATKLREAARPYIAKEKKKSFFKAIVEKNINGVHQALDLGIDLSLDGSYKHYSGRPLDIAAQKGSLEIVEILLSKGAQITLTDRFDGNCLHAALNADDIGPDIIPLLKLLISAGADINSEDGLGKTPLMKSVLLLPRGKMDITRPQETYDYINIFNEHVLAIIKLLIEAGADPYKPNTSGVSAYNAVGRAFPAEGMFAVFINRLLYPRILLLKPLGSSGII